MGNFYTQVLVRSKKREEAIGLLAKLKRRCFISDDLDGWLLVLDSKTEDQNIDDLDDLAFTLAHDLECHSVAILNHDDDHLLIRLFGPEGHLGDVSGSWASCSLLRKIAEARCLTVSLCFTFWRPYIFEISRHKKICRLLGLPEWVAGIGFKYYEGSDCPAETPELKKL